MSCRDSSASLRFARDQWHPSARDLAERVLRKVQVMGSRQVRLWRGMLLTYPDRVRRGYGTRGELVGVYTITARLEWIEEDIERALSDS